LIEEARRQVFNELLSTYLRLKKWKENPAASKREMGVVARWLTPDAANDKPVSDDELVSMKDFLQAHAPTSYRSIFGNP
jgi:hypothetical protein